jgi:hypothetical protein
MDNRVNNGGARDGAGRKPKADEIKLIEALDRHIDSDEYSISYKDLSKKETSKQYRYT